MFNVLKSNLRVCGCAHSAQKFNLAKYALCLHIVNREEGLECRQTSKAFALIGFRC